MDDQIEWHEAMTMFIVYILYAIFMKYNSSIEYYVKKKLKQNNTKVDVAINNSYTNNINSVFINN